MSSGNSALSPAATLQILWGSPPHQMPMEITVVASANSVFLTVLRKVALGLAGSSPSGRTTWSLEGYWRDMRGLVAYRDGAAFTTPTLGPFLGTILEEGDLVGRDALFATATATL